MADNFVAKHISFSVNIGYDVFLICGIVDMHYRFVKIGVKLLINCGDLFYAKVFKNLNKGVLDKGNAFFEFFVLAFIVERSFEVIKNGKKLFDCIYRCVAIDRIFFSLAALSEVVVFRRVRRYLS